MIAIRNQSSNERQLSVWICLVAYRHRTWQLRLHPSLAPRLKPGLGANLWKMSKLTCVISSKGILRDHVHLFNDFPAVLHAGWRIFRAGQRHFWPIARLKRLPVIMHVSVSITCYTYVARHLCGSVSKAHKDHAENSHPKHTFLFWTVGRKSPLALQLPEVRKSMVRTRSGLPVSVLRFSRPSY